MQEHRSAIATLCKTHINYVSDPKWDHAYSTFWNKLHHDLFRGNQYYGVSSFFSLWFEQVIFDIVSDCFSTDELISCITSGNDSIGDRWLDEQVDAIKSEVAKSLLGTRYL